jgi:uncharacterized protein (TIRG00374 family)
MTYMKESSSHKAALWIIARLAAVIMIFIFLIYFEMLDFQKVQQMLFQWWTAAAAICFLTGVIVSTFRWQILLIAVGIRPGIKIVIRLSLIGYAFSTIIPGAVSGDIIKAYYIVKRRSNKRTVAATTILLDRALGLFTMLLTAAVSIGVLLLMPQLSQDPEQKSRLLYMPNNLLFVQRNLFSDQKFLWNKPLRKPTNCPCLCAPKLRTLRHFGVDDC